MKKFLMVTAHPDDETLWGSSLFQRFPSAYWTVICCSTPVKDPERATHKFFEACHIQGVKGARLLPNVMDEGIDKPLGNLSGVMAYVYEQPDHVFTHNDRGEYGHPHHKQVNKFVCDNFGKIPRSYFGYGFGEKGTGSFDTYSHELTADELDIKNQAIHCYDHMYRGRPYYEVLYEWLDKKQPNYKWNREMFIGQHPE
jgi:LmbE family N-acetylglucosaminyl deacetylase